MPARKNNLVIFKPVWSEKEKETLREYYPRAPWPKLVEMLPGRTPAAIQIKAHVYGIKRAKKASIPMETRIAMSANRKIHGKAARSVCIMLHLHGQNMKEDPDRLNSKYMLKIIKSVNGPIAAKGKQ